MKKLRYYKKKVFVQISIYVVTIKSTVYSQHLFYLIKTHFIDLKLMKLKFLFESWLY